MSMDVTASGSGLKYQWEYYDAKSGSWKTYEGKTSSTLKSQIYADWNGLRLRCRVTDANGNSATSNEATVNILQSEDWELPIM